MTKILSKPRREKILNKINHTPILWGHWQSIGGLNVALQHAIIQSGELPEDVSVNCDEILSVNENEYCMQIELFNGEQLKLNQSLKLIVVKKEGKFLDREGQNVGFFLKDVSWEE